MTVRVANPARLWPTDPIAAVTHDDPYAYYRDLAACPLHNDERLGLWIAASPADVVEVLGNPLARSRPATAAVPAHLVGTSAGEMFGRLVRMTDGHGQQSLKKAIR